MDKYWIRNARVKLQSLELFWAGIPANAFMFGNTKTEVNEQFYCRHLRSKFDTITRINDNMQTIHAAVYYCCYIASISMACANVENGIDPLDFGLVSFHFISFRCYISLDTCFDSRYCLFLCQTTNAGLVYICITVNYEYNRKKNS